MAVEGQRHVVFKVHGQRGQKQHIVAAGEYKTAGPGIVSSLTAGGSNCFALQCQQAVEDFEPEHTGNIVCIVL